MNTNTLGTLGLRRRAAAAVLALTTTTGVGLATMAATAPADAAPAAHSSVAQVTASDGRAIGQTRDTNPGLSGQCTDGAAEQFHAYSGLYPALTGNAKDWFASAQATGWSTVYDAQPNSIVVFQPGVQGADPTYGHVAWVVSTEQHADGLYVHIVEMNGSAGPGQYDERTIKDVVGMSYILAPAAG